MINFIKKYESANPKQHPVGMTFPSRGATNAVLYNSPTDWISPNLGGAEESYGENPSPPRLGKVIVNDSDHLWGHVAGDGVWVWKSFCRGLNVLLMDDLVPLPTWQDSVREGMEQTRRYALRMNLAAMAPSSDLSTTTYCLADRGKEYLVYQPGIKGEFAVDLTGAPGTFSVEWFSPTTGKTTSAGPISGGGKVRFSTPFGGPAVLCLKSTGGH